MKYKLLYIIMVLSLSACSNGEHQDIVSWMAEQETTLKGKIEPLPPAKTFQATSYEAKIDPFSRADNIRSIRTIIKNKYAPDMSRSKEGLERFDLQILKMVGTIKKDGKMFAMIKDSDKAVHYVTVGNYLGNNFGKIISITESEIILEERIRDVDAWVKKETKIFLYEAPIQKQ